MMFKMLSSILMMLALGVSGAASQSVHIALPDSAVDAGAQIDIPVTVSDITSQDAVLSGEWTFTTSNGLIELRGTETAGTLLDGVNTDFNYTSGTFVFASTKSIVGEGVLMVLKVKVSDDAQKFQEVTIGLDDVRLNEDNPAVTYDDGIIRVRGVAISPGKPSTPLVVGDLLQLDLSGTVTPPVTWSSSADTVASISPDGIVKAMSPGTLRIIAEDATGLTDTTEYFRVEPANLLDLTVEVSDASVYQTLEDTVQLRVTDISGLNVISGQFDLVYSPDKIEILSLSTVGTLLDGRPAPTIFREENRVRVVFADTEPFEGEGALLNIGFRVLREAKGSTTIQPQNVQFNESFQAEMREGTINIIPAPEIVVEPAEADVTKGFSHLFEVPSGGSAPYTWSVDDEEIATINAETGELQALARGETYVTATDADNFSSAPVRVVVNDVTVKLPEAEILDDNVIELPVETMDVTGLGIIAYELEVEVDTTVVSFLGIETSGSLSDGMNVFHSKDTGVIKVAVASVNPFENAGDLIRFRFSASETAVSGDISPVQLARVQFNEPGKESPTATLQSGAISIQKTSPPGAVQLLSPVDGSQDVELEATLSWEERADASSYELLLSPNSDLSEPVIRETGLTETSFTTDSLDYLSEYHWQVRATGAGGTGPWSEKWSYRVKDREPLTTPVLISPEDGVTDLPKTLIFRWETVPEAVEYRLLAAPENTFSNLVADTTIATTELEIILPENQAIYYWKVIASDGTRNSESEIRNLSTRIGIPAVPLPASPAIQTADTDTVVVLSWHGADFAESYRLEWTTDPLFEESITTETTSDTTWVLNGLDFEMSYFWRVTGINERGDGDTSAAFSFTTRALDVLAVPILESPGENAEGVPLNVLFRWSDVSDAINYRLLLATNASLESPVIDSTLSVTELEIDSLEYSTDYFWQVTAVNDTQSSGSVIRKFTTMNEQGEIPQLASPYDGSAETDTILTLSWHRASLAESYVVELATSQNFDKGLTTLAAPDTFTVVTGLVYETQYFWRVRGVNSDLESEFSAPWSFTTKQKPVMDPGLGNVSLVSPINGSTGMPLSLQLIWQDDVAGENYRIQVSTLNDFGILVFDELHSDNQTYIDLPANETIYYWRVRSESGSSVGEWSDVWMLSTQPELPQKVELSEPISGVITTEDTIKLTWHISFPEVTNYQVQVADNPEFSGALVDSVLADTSVQVGPIEDEGIYYWRVRAENQVGFGRFSDAGSLSVEVATSVDGNDKLTPVTFELMQNYPNPFNPSTMIEYQLPETGQVKLAVYNIDGREVVRLVDEVQSSGRHRVRFMARGFASGLYIYRIEAGRYRQVRKMTLIK